MKPEHQSRYLLKLTRSKGKMYEFGIDEAHHLAIPIDAEPASLFLLTIGILGDYAAEIADAPDAQISPTEELQFSAKFFDAYLESKFTGAIPQDVLLFASSAYYLAERPGSSFVLAKKFENNPAGDILENFLRWLLQSKWADLPEGQGYFYNEVRGLARKISTHFLSGESSPKELHTEFSVLRAKVYGVGTPRNVLFADILIAVAALRIEASSWELLPRYSGIGKERWASAIQRVNFPKELWPSQIMLGLQGIFNGISGLVQMPTSAGKTRSLEIILRSAFLANRARMAVVVVPFRALCHEVGGALRDAFASDDVKVNELSDALQIDFIDELAELFGAEAPTTKYILVLTPEKLLYVLRQQPDLANLIGLVAYDEGHQFDSGARGIVYELLLTEIKSLLPAEAQTLLISAVIKNSAPVANWLIGDGAVVVDGTNLFPTARSIAFASWIEAAGQLMFFDEQPVRRDNFDYFVPRVIEQQKLESRGREQDRYFPEKGKNSPKEVSLYLGISVVSQGAVAVFCGRKDTAEGMADRIVEVYSRGYEKVPPSTFSDAAEISAMMRLISKHFGEESNLFKAAELGAFVHHGSTPHGIRLAIEYGMQQGLLKYVVCTSTLAQGVNLPIRYLIVSSIYQAGERIKTRDFLNLIGRAGRAGMHTEGLVIFADSNAMDNRAGAPWQFDLSANLLAPEKSEDVSSSLLTIIHPLVDRSGKLILPLAFSDLASLLVSSEIHMNEWAAVTARVNSKFEAQHLLAQLKRKRRLQNAVESYLMSNRGVGTTQEFQTRASELATLTFAYSIASAQEKAELQELFQVVSGYIDRMAPQYEKQQTYAKTLLGVSDARKVEEWVQKHRDALVALKTSSDWLSFIWPLFQELLDDQFFHAVYPVDLPKQLIERWIYGVPYSDIIKYAADQKGTKPWGVKRRVLTVLDTMEFVEKTVSFDCSLILSAVAQFLFGRDMLNDEASSLFLFQKALKYGLPDRLSVSAFESGLADRVISQEVAASLSAAGYVEQYIGNALNDHRDIIKKSVSGFPSYFKMICANMK